MYSEKVQRPPRRGELPPKGLKYSDILMNNELAKVLLYSLRPGWYLWMQVSEGSAIHYIKNINIIDKED